VGEEIKIRIGTYPTVRNLFRIENQHHFRGCVAKFHIYIFNAESEWVIGIALEAKTNNPLFLVCLKDGRRFISKDVIVNKSN